MVGHVSMEDPLSIQRRSALMARVRSTGNTSTELKAESLLRAAGLKGWINHPEGVPGKPDFFFEVERLALFVDGCFWHGCPTCQRRVPKTRRGFWKAKLESNRLRDRRIIRLLHKEGYKTIRVWEHALDDQRWLKRLLLIVGLPSTSRAARKGRATETTLKRAQKSRAGS